MMKHYDLDGSGTLDFEEFLSMLARLQAEAQGDEVKVGQLVKQYATHYSRRLSVASQARAAGIAAGRTVFKKGGQLDEVGTTAALATEAAGGSAEDSKKASESARQTALVLLNKELHEAAELGDTEYLVDCLDRGADVRWVNDRIDSMSALQVACNNSKTECVQILVDHDADVNFVNKQVWSSDVGPPNRKL
jgi:hypothetical protein